MQFTDHEDGTTVLLLHTSTSALAFNAFHSQSQKSPFAGTPETRLQFSLLASVKSVVCYSTSTCPS